MQERFTHQLIMALSADAAKEIWTHASHLISEEFLLEHGIRDELHDEAVKKVKTYALEQLDHDPANVLIHHQFAEALWLAYRATIGSELIPHVRVFFPEYCGLLRQPDGPSRFTVTRAVIEYFDHFCEALRHSRVVYLQIPDDYAQAESRVIEALILHIPKLRTVESGDICSTVLSAIQARSRQDLPEVVEYHVTNAYGLIPYVRLAHWYKETNHPLEISIKPPAQPDHKRFVNDKLQQRSRIRNTDTDWILEQWQTQRKRRRDAENCPKCGQYDPRSSHYFRFVPGAGSYVCELKSIMSGIHVDDNAEADSPDAAE